MTYIIELKPEVAQRIEAKAAQSGMKPEAFLEELAEDATRPQNGTIPDAEFERLQKEIFAEYASVFEALALGPK